MLYIWLNYEGVTHYEFIPDSRTNLYSKQLEQMYAIIRQKYLSC